MNPGAKIENIYVVPASLVAGTSAFVFVYVWTRVLPSLFGSPVLVDGWVPLSVLGGVVLGSVYFGRRARFVGSPARMFSLTLFAFGIVGLPVWQLLRVMGKAPDILISAGVTSTAALTAVLAAATLCLLLIPGFLLGGVLTFGTMRAAQSRFSRSFPLWCLFTGLAVGTVLLAFGMLPHLSHVYCMAIASAAAVITGLVGFRGSSKARQADIAPRRQEAGPSGSSADTPSAVLESAFIVAVAAWVVLWARLFLLSTGSSLQAFAALSTAFLTGLAAGSALSTLVPGRPVDDKTRMGIVAGATAIMLLFLARQAGSLPLMFLDASGDLPLVWGDLLAAYFSLAFLTLFAPALLLGTFLQTAWDAAGSGTGRSAGFRATWFALASLVALLATRFIPSGSIALRGMILGLPLVSLGVSLVFLLAVKSARATGAVCAAVVVVAVILLRLTQPAWNHAILSQGLYTLPIEFKQVENLSRVLEGRDILFHRTDRDRAVSVDRTPDALTLRVDGSARASAESGMVPRLLAGHIPLLLHADPQKVFIDGLGAGLTLRAVETYPVEEIYCAEPSAAAVEAAGLFSAYNGDALEDARLNLQRASTPNHLLLTGNRYDVIVLRNPPPFALSSAERMTAEFFALARSRLSPGGILCQQVSMFELETDFFRSFAKSFAYHFPHVTVWSAGGDDVLLLGSSRPFIFPEEGIRNRMSLAEVDKDLTKLGMTDPLAFLSCFVMRRHILMDLCGAADLLTEGSNRLLVEWPKRTLHLVRTDGLEEVGSAAENPIVLIRGMDDESTEYKLLRDRLDRCRKAREFSVRSLVAVREGKVREAVSLLGESQGLCALNGTYRHGLADYYIMLSRSLVSARRIEEAVEAARRAVELLPQSPRTYYNLASVEMVRDRATAIALLERAVTLNPYYVPGYLLKAQAELASGEAEEAAETVGLVLPMEPFNTEAHHIRGLSFIQRRMYAEGRAELEIVLEAEPENTEALDALAYGWLVEDELDRAETLYERLLEIDPEHLGALNNYATILAEKGRYREAITVWTKALELNPGNRDIIDNIEEARQNMRR